MACNHSNPQGYRFCATCGQALPVTPCNCGFVGQAGDVYCGGCGTARESASPNPVGLLDLTPGQIRYDLAEVLADVTLNRNAFVRDATHVSQADIDSLFKVPSVAEEQAT